MFHKIKWSVVENNSLKLLITLAKIGKKAYKIYKKSKKMNSKKSKRLKGIIEKVEKKRLEKRPTWRKSEKDELAKHGSEAKEQVSFKNQI